MSPSGITAIALLGWAVAALGQQPGPAPIVVRGRGGETTITEGDEQRRLDPGRRDRGLLIARSGAGDSAFEVPGTESIDGGEALLPDVPVAPFGGDAYSRGRVPSPTPGDAAQAHPSGGLPSGYQPSSSLSERLPGNPHEPFARGYSPSSDLNRRLQEAARNSTTVWGP